MKATYSTAQVMSLVSGFAYVEGAAIGRILGFMIGLGDEPSLLLAVDFQKDCREVLLKQHPWLNEVPFNGHPPKEWKTYLSDMESAHGKELVITCLAEFRNGITKPHDVLPSDYRP